MRSVPAALVLAVLLVSAGCLGTVGGDGAVVGHADPPRDVLGWEDGYWHDEPLDVTAGDGLNESELDAAVARTTARVEVLRGLEFSEPVPVEVISRAELRERWERNRSAATRAWNDQAWEALFLVGEGTDASGALDGVFGDTVVGYYAPADGEIVLVSDDPENLSVGRGTLVHELVHALQDQRLRLSFGRSTMDGELAADGLVEGDANHVQARYERRCGEEWRCLPRRPGPTGASFDRGVFLATFVPYSDGPSLVAALRERGGWAAVDAAYRDPPASTEQVIHPGKYPDEAPADVAVADRSSPAWRPFAPEGRENPAETVGEAALVATLWASGVLESGAIRSEDPDSPYEYGHEATEGWAGDALVPYRSGDRFGYVFRTEWDSPADAAEFHRAYLAVLRANGAVERDDGVYRIPEGEPYADAFRVRREGTTVTVVNAPTAPELSAVHASEADAGR